MVLDIASFQESEHVAIHVLGHDGVEDGLNDRCVHNDDLSHDHSSVGSASYRRLPPHEDDLFNRSGLLSIMQHLRSMCRALAQHLHSIGGPQLFDNA